MMKSPAIPPQILSLLLISLIRMICLLGMIGIASDALATAASGGESDVMQVTMHPTKGAKKRVSKIVVRKNATPLPKFSAAFVQEPHDPYAPLEESAPRMKTASAVIEKKPRLAAVPYPTPEPIGRRSEVAVETSRSAETPPSISMASPAKIPATGIWSPMAWLDYSALGVIVTPVVATTPTAGTTQTSDYVLDQILTIGAGLDITNNFHLSVDAHLQYQTTLDSAQTTASGGSSAGNAAPSSFQVNDVYAHAVSRFNLQNLFSGPSSVKLDLGALAPLSSSAGDAGYRAVYDANVTLSTRLIPGLLTLQNTVGGDLIWNQYQYSPQTDLANQQGGIEYRLGALWHFTRDFEWLIGGGIKDTFLFDGSAATHFNAATTLSYKIAGWLFHVGYSAGTFQDLSPQDQWYIDRNEQGVSAGLGVRF